VTIRTCKVSCFDTRGVENTVQVTAQSLYEAVAQALRVLREDDWSEDPNRGPASVVVAIGHPEVEHKVRIKDFEKWLDSAARSPADMALKSRLRNIVGR
jgi:hypothetical protein